MPGLSQVWVSKNMF